MPDSILANLDLVTVTGRWVTLEGGVGQGTVTFTPDTVIKDPATREIVLPVAFTETLDANGRISVQLPATDDPDLEPTGWTYTVTENIGGVRKNRRTYTMVVPHDGGPIDLVAVSTESAPSAGETTYISLPYFTVWVPADGDPGQVLTRGEDGAEWSTPTGGGEGGGAVDSVNGQTGVVVLDAGHVGAATAAQGALADTAVQPESLAEVATSGAYSDLAGTPTLGTAAAAAATDFATAAQGALAASAVQPGDVRLVNTDGEPAARLFFGTVDPSTLVGDLTDNDWWIGPADP